MQGKQSVHRRQVRLVGLVLLGLVILGWPVQSALRAAQDPSGALVSTAWVADHLSDSDLVLLHVGPDAGYASAHVPGARLVSYDAIGGGMDHGPNENMLEMPEPARLRSVLASMGISDGSRIVVYSGTANGVSLATRVVLTLQYAGLGARTSLMQGGMPVWVAEQRPTSTEVPASKEGVLSALTIAPLVVDGDYVAANLATSGVRIVDARAAAFYDGSRNGGDRETPHKTGHIEGAVSVPFNTTYDAQGRFKSLDELKALFESAGVTPGESLIAYCHLGQQATATMFAARLLGYDVKLYDGSFEDWSRRPNAPVSVRK
jgi:thiosulfate/3-mercaptopyruvate sulfurtransferase